MFIYNNIFFSVMSSNKSYAETHTKLRNAVYWLAALIFASPFVVNSNTLYYLSGEFIVWLILKCFFVLLTYLSFIYLCALFYKVTHQKFFKPSIIFFALLSLFHIVSIVLENTTRTEKNISTALNISNLIFGIICWILFATTFVIFYLAFQNTMKGELNFFLLVYAGLMAITGFLYHITYFVVSVCTNCEDTIGEMLINTYLLYNSLPTILGILLAVFLIIKASNISQVLSSTT